MRYPLLAAIQLLHLDQANESDALIAATALVHGLTVVTRNVSDFKSSGVTVIDPDYLSTWELHARQ